MEDVCEAVESVVKEEVNAFVGFPKIARLSREMIVTEKIDGTNAQILITNDFQIFVGSRTKWITRFNDNFGFAEWVEDHKEEILTLGPGRYFGEWWGKGIQRRYNLEEKRLSLFNVSSFALYGTEPKILSSEFAKETKYQRILPPCIGLVPILYQGVFDTTAVDKCLTDLKEFGSKASPGFMNPEGVVVFHIASGTSFKKTIKDDGIPKSKAM